MSGGLPVRVFRTEEMREIDRVTIEEYGIPGMVLMENAGLQVLRVVVGILGSFPGRRAVVLCGKGNNGGDGFVVARHLINSGSQVQVFLAGEAEAVKGDVRTNLDILDRMGVVPVELGPETIREFRETLKDADLIVDALFGTGFAGAASGFHGEAIEAVNRARSEYGLTVVAVDIPSGLPGDTGRPAGPCIRADKTVTFGFPKPGQLLYPGAEYVGGLIVADISLPTGAPGRAGLDLVPAAFMVTPAMAGSALPRRSPDAHKGTYGHVLVVAGSPGYSGAATLTATAALRGGAGLVTAAVPETIHDIMEIKLTEAMTRPLPVVDGHLTPDAVPEVLRLAGKATAVALGPGLALASETVSFVRRFVPRCPIPLVIDADGLNALVGQTDIIKECKVPVVLTPHPGEMARLLGMATNQVQGDRLGTARRLAQTTGAVVVLKGARSVTADPRGRLWINTTGNPGMATGGSGDVLTGVIAALMAQGLEAEHAAWLGVYLHGLAGDLGTGRLGEVSLTAGDVLHYLPEAWRQAADVRADISHPKGEYI